MAQLKLSPEDQLRRLNALVNEFDNFQSLPTEVLTRRPAPGKWSTIEVAAHLNAIYDIYRDRITATLEKLPEGEWEKDHFPARWWPALFIKMMRPQGTKRNWKMKTMKRFEPGVEAESAARTDVEEVFQTFFENHEHLRQAILASRKKKVRGAKLISSIGPIVQFYLPEAVDFLLVHEERHLVQAQEVLAQVVTVEVE